MLFSRMKINARAGSRISRKYFRIKFYANFRVIGNSEAIDTNETREQLVFVYIYTR